jgi:hypothetical protein
MSLRVNTKTKVPNALKLYNHLLSYLFEEEWDELRLFSIKEIETLKKAKKVLGEVINRNK